MSLKLLLRLVRNVLPWVEFADYTILELYGLLSDEQKRYFDTLKDAAMAKPQAKLAVGRSFMNIKIGKRSILKLRIRRLFIKKKLDFLYIIN